MESIEEHNSFSNYKNERQSIQLKWDNLKKVNIVPSLHQKNKNITTNHIINQKLPNNQY